MTTLTVFADNDPRTVLGTYADTDSIRDQLASVGVEYERWDASQPLSAAANADEIFDAYAAQIDLLKRRYGFITVDVVSMQPDAPNAAEARGKFLSEHTHDDFETRFFVGGSGAFYIRAGGKVFMTVCTQGDLINLPANTTHWFDMGSKPDFKAIRFFRVAEGWVGHFTGDTIAERFPKYEIAA